MSDIEFTPYCGNPICFAQIARNKGLVLSCGCFLCSTCESSFAGVCPGCKNKEAKSVSLNNLPSEVANVTGDTANDFERIFTALKFQIQHYKKQLSLAADIIQRQQRELSAFKRSSQEELVGMNFGVAKRGFQEVPMKAATEAETTGGRPASAAETPPRHPAAASGIKDGRITHRWGPSHPSTPISAAARGSQSYAGPGARPGSAGSMRGVIHAEGYSTPSCRVRSPYTQISAGLSTTGQQAKQTVISKDVYRNDLPCQNNMYDENCSLNSVRGRLQPSLVSNSHSTPANVNRISQFSSLPEYDLPSRARGFGAQHGYSSNTSSTDERSNIEARRVSYSSSGTVPAR